LEISILDHGAVGDGKTLNTSAIQAALTAASGTGARVTIPAGTFLSGSLVIGLNTELHLAEGATLLASANYEHYSLDHDIAVLTDGLVNETVLPRRAFIAAYQANELTISGPGTISGNADEFIEKRGTYIHEMRGPEGGRSQYLERPFTLFLIDSQNVILEDFTLRDPAFWAIRTTGCDDLKIRNIKIITDLMVPNADGIDIDRCENVSITNCVIHTADDSISLKSCSETAIYGDVKNIHISDCEFISTSGAITLGTESVGDISDVLVENCEVKKSHRGFAVRSREGGLISNVVFRNCKVDTRSFDPSWWGHGEPLHVTAFAWNSPENVGEGNPERALEGKVSGILFDKIECDADAGILNWAAHEGLVNEVEYRNVTLKLHKKTKWPSRIDLRPNDLQPVVTRPHNAFELVNVSSVSLFDCVVEWDEQSRADFGDAVNVINSPNFEVHNLVESGSHE
jgi:polygalacturonase